uniref:Allantoate amidinohydrolase n=1 Tax=Sinocyclocheilus grahami TaxID=75366 RepID=A0A672QWA9_SINGR
MYCLTVAIYILIFIDCVCILKLMNKLLTLSFKVIFATDEWFAPARNLLKRDPPEFIASAFTDYGKWMDGWETRRKRIPGHDWCIIQLGVPGIINGLDVDTSFFTGNYAPFTSVQAACLDQMPSFTLEGDRTGMAASPSQFEAVAQLNTDSWEELVPMIKLNPGYSESCHNYLNVTYPHRVTHIRLNIYPDGGIARLKVYGIGMKDWSTVSSQDLVDIVALVNGGVCVGYSNAHFGHPRNIIGLGRADNMGDGWETARRLDRPKVLKVDEKGILQVPGCEWAVLRLGHPGIISKIEVDTNHFKGTLSIEYLFTFCSIFLSRCFPSESTVSVWKPGSASSVMQCGPVTHVRLVIAPDGGVSRLRLWGRPVSNNLTHPQQFSKL